MKLIRERIDAHEPTLAKYPDSTQVQITLYTVG
jgi:hypothetical protein